MPPELATEIIRGIRGTEDAEHAEDPDLLVKSLLSSMAATSSFHDVPCAPVVSAIQQEELAIKNTNRCTCFKMNDGSIQQIDLKNGMKETYHDEYTSAPLPKEHLTEAMYDEIDYFNDHVWVGVPLAEAQRDPTAKMIGTRWVLCNKGDDAKPDVRARLVAQ